MIIGAAARSQRRTKNMMITIRAGSVELIVNGGRTLSSLLYALQNLAGFSWFSCLSSNSTSCTAWQQQIARSF
jgi:hypothetical protein